MGSSSKSSASVVNEQQNQQQLVSAHRERRKKGGIISAALQDPSIRDHLDEQIQDCLRPQLSIRKLDIAKGRKKRTRRQFRDQNQRTNLICSENSNLLVELMSVEEQKHLSCKERRLIGPPPLSFPSHKSFSRSLDSTSTSSSRTPVDCLEKQRRCGRLHSPLTACFCNRALPPSFRSYIRQYRKHSLESCSRNVPRRVAQWESRGTDPESS